MSNFLLELSQANQARSLEWDPTHRLDAMFFALELAGEVGEVCNKIKKLHRELLGLRGSRTTHRELENEIGDTLICLSLLCNELNINLEFVTARKFNETSEALDLKARL